MRWRGLTLRRATAVGLALMGGSLLPGGAAQQESQSRSAPAPPPAQAQAAQGQPAQDGARPQPPSQQAQPPPARAATPAPGPQANAHLWFDPTQLPAFTGTVERYLANPRGETDRLVFREGPQVVFPPDMAAGVRQAAPPGRPVTVWGIRARNAPVITMLAYSANPAEMPPVMVDRLYWRFTGPEGQEHPVTLAVAGVVKAPYYTPQGEVGGAILEDGTVVVLPAGAVPPAVPPLRDLLRPGQRLAAEGIGHAGEAGRALFAERIGESAETLRPVPSAAATPPDGAAAAAPQR